MKKIKVISVIMLFSFLNACTPNEHRFNFGDHQPQLSSDHILLQDGYKLPYRKWLVPEKKKTKAVLLAVHGFNDYSKAYNDVAPQFAENGILTYAYDQRGYGKTDKHGIWPGAKNLRRDFKTVFSLLKEKHPDIPFYVMGESMGGAIVTSSLLSVPEDQIEGVILVAPAYWGKELMSWLQSSSLWVLSHSFPWVKLSSKLMRTKPTDNPEALSAYENDPYVINSSRIDALYGVTNVMNDAWTYLPNFKHKALFLYGRHEEVLPASIIPEVYKRLPEEASHKQTKMYYPKGFHMLLRDLQGDVVIKDIISWVKDSEKTLPSKLYYKE